MLLSRASAIIVFIISIGSAVTLATPEPWLPQSIAQNVNAGDRNMPRWIQQLNLTPEQTQRMQSIGNKYRQQMSNCSQALRQAQSELRQLISSDATAEALRNKHRQVESLRQQLANIRFESLLEMRSVLTPTQRRLFAETMENKRQNFRNRSVNEAQQQR